MPDIPIFDDRIIFTVRRDGSVSKCAAPVSGVWLCINICVIGRNGDVVRTPEPVAHSIGIIISRPDTGTLIIGIDQRYQTIEIYLSVGIANAVGLNTERKSYLPVEVIIIRTRPECTRVSRSVEPQEVRAAQFFNETNFLPIIESVIVGICFRRMRPAAVLVEVTDTVRIHVCRRTIVASP